MGRFRRWITLVSRAGVWQIQDQELVDRVILTAGTRKSDLAAHANSVLLGQNVEQLAQLCQDMGHPKYRGKQIHDSLMHGASSVNDLNLVRPEQKAFCVLRPSNYLQLDPFSPGSASSVAAICSSVQDHYIHTLILVQLPKALRADLVAANITTGRSRPFSDVTAADGTRKFLRQLHDGRVVETVGIPTDAGVKPRLTACVSSQVRHRSFLPHSSQVAF